MPSKKSPKKKTTAKKKTSPKKTAARKATSKKAAKKASVKKSARPATKKGARKASAEASSGKESKGKPKASDLIKRQSHTPAIFKTSSKRPTHIVFTIEEVREVLKKRAEEEKKEQAEKKPASNQTVAKVAEAKLEEVAPPQKSKHHAASLDDILGLSGGSGAASRSGPDSVPAKHRKYYDLLIELRNEVRAELNLHSNDTLKRSQKDDAGDIAISVDAGTDNFDRDFALSLLSSEQEALNEIEAAIQRIYNGTYGNCEVTGEPIKAERLEAVPFTRFSVEGQKQYEMNTRKRVNRAGAFLNEASGEKITFGDDDSDN